MNLVEAYNVVSVIKDIEDLLSSVNKNNYKDKLSIARKEILKNNLCTFFNTDFKDKNTLMISTSIDNQKYFLLWDITKKKFTHQEVREASRNAYS